MNAKKKRVAIFGWNPEVVDYSKWPGVTAEQIATALQAENKRLTELGYEVTPFFIDDAESACQVVRSALQQGTYDCVLIGAAVRADPECLLLFERIINAVHEAAPTAKICFNSHSGDTAEAVQRWI